MDSFCVSALVPCIGGCCARTLARTSTTIFKVPFARALRLSALTILKTNMSENLGSWFKCATMFSLLPSSSQLSISHPATDFESERLLVGLVVIVVSDIPTQPRCPSQTRQWATSSASRSRACAHPAPPRVTQALPPPPAPAPASAPASASVPAVARVPQVSCSARCRSSGASTCGYHPQHTMRSVR